MSYSCNACGRYVTSGGCGCYSPSPVNVPTTLAAVRADAERATIAAVVAYLDSESVGEDGGAVRALSELIADGQWRRFLARPPRKDPPR